MFTTLCILDITVNNSYLQGSLCILVQLRCWLRQTVECFWNDCGMCGISLIEHHVHAREPHTTISYYIFGTYM